MPDPKDRRLQADPMRPDNPEEDWGEPKDAEGQHGANHSARQPRGPSDRAHGVKSRAAHKDMVSRRA